MPIEIEVTVSPGLGQPVDLTPYLEAGMGPAVREVKSSADAALERLFRHRPPIDRAHHRAGRAGYGPLHGSLTTYAFAVQGDGAVGFVRTNVYYARFLERGAKAHPLAASRGHVLPILQAGGGGPHFRPRAKHPGVRPRYWMRGAAAENVQDVIGIFTREAERWAADAQAGMTAGMPG
jgi:hypothetical protein